MEVLLFAGARDLAETEILTIDVTPPTTVAAVRDAIADAVPKLSGLLAVSRLAVDGSFANEETIIESSSEVAPIPPVSGG